MTSNKDAVLKLVESETYTVYRESPFGDPYVVPKSLWSRYIRAFAAFIAVRNELGELMDGKRHNAARGRERLNRHP